LNSPHFAVGIDVGGSAIKAALVDLATGTLASHRASMATPAQASVEHLLESMQQIVPAESPAAKVGIAFPSVIVGGTARTAANLNKDWIGQPLAALGARRLNRAVTAINDADAAGLAEMTYGAGRDARGTVLILTLGTGIGSAIFLDGKLLPNTEFGHLEVDDQEAEHRASAHAKVSKNLTWAAWTQELNLVINRLHALIWPDLVLLCGGITEDPYPFVDSLHCPAPIRIGSLRADAGIVGAALATTQAQR
jgi:polyphosphate glucokinase